MQESQVCKSYDGREAVPTCDCGQCTTQHRTNSFAESPMEGALAANGVCRQQPPERVIKVLGNHVRL